MLRTTMAVVLAARLMLAPWAAAQDAATAGPIAAAAARQAAIAKPAPARGPMPTGLKWTGIGLALHGAAVGTTGLIFCAADACGRNPEIGFGVAGASLLAGVIVLHVADRKRLPAAQDDDVPPAGAGPIAAAATREAVDAPQPTSRSMPPGLKWTGVSLLGASLLPVTVARLGDCLPDGPYCRRQRKRAYAVGGAMAGTGVLLLAIGGARRDAAPLPSVEIGGGRVSVIHRLTF